MHITFNLDHVFNGSSPDLENTRVLSALLACLVEIDYAYLKAHTVPRLYDSGVKYGRTKLWESIPELYKRGRGDCKSLSAALIAEYKLRGIFSKPVFRFMPHSNGENYHILVMVPGKNGLSRKLFEDPSKRLGMNRLSDARVFFDRSEVSGETSGLFDSMMKLFSTNSPKRKRGNNVRR